MVQKIPSLLFAVLFLVFLISVVQSRHVQTQHIPNYTTNTTSIVHFTSTQNSFESPHVTPINGSTFEWWWFSVTSPSSLASLTIIFFTTSVEAFPLTQVSPGILSVNIQALFPNGTRYDTILPASSATIKSGGDLGNGVFGQFDGVAPSTFSGSSDLKTFEVGINALDLGVQGCLTLQSTAPAHYACTCDIGPGAKLEVFPHIGWTNALPSATANGKFTLGGSSLDFVNALGYHDMNWGDAPFLELVQNWYWGHAKLGPYTIVWFDGIDASGAENVNAYVSNDGHVVLASCEPGSVIVRPVGGAATYPPTPDNGQFNHLHIVFDLGGGSLFSVNITKTAEIVGAPGLYYRWTGRAKGGMEGENSFEGPAEFEEFTIV